MVGKLCFTKLLPRTVKLADLKNSVPCTARFIKHLASTCTGWKNIIYWKFVSENRS